MPLPPGATLASAPLTDAAGGGAVDLAGLAAGRPVLLFLYEPGCPATTVAAPVLPRFAAIPGLALVAISQDGPAEALAFAAASGWPAAVRTLVDGPPWAASDALAARVTPTWTLVAADGRVAASAEGWARGDVNGLAAAAAALLGVPAPVISAEGGAEPPWRPG